MYINMASGPPLYLLQPPKLGSVNASGCGGSVSTYINVNKCNYLKSSLENAHCYCCTIVIVRLDIESLAVWIDSRFQAS